ncbi:MAG TPA: xanthine dehydrogenase family protein subunit M [Rhizobiaceae bacterium]|nr:xanthine dehydrogenase family protein subunit M [Rhizobiaceae bacterium]
MTRYAKPADLDEALALLASDRWKVLAGGTDFYPALGARPLRENVLDINGLSALRGISTTDGHVVIGARTSWSDVIRHDLPHAFDCLKEAAREVGSVQIQNTGTVAGNLCNASPAADGVPALMALDAEVELRSAAGARHLPLSEFILGNRKTALRPDELMTAIRVPLASTAGRSAFVKLGARRYLVISIAMAAARIVLDREGRIAEAALAIGSCSAVAKRLPALEAALAGQRIDGEFVKKIEPGQLSSLTPIDDVRGSAEYRLAAAREILARAIRRAASGDRPEGLSEGRAAA